MLRLLSSAQHWAKVLRVADVTVVKFIDGKERQVENAGRTALSWWRKINAARFQLDARGDRDLHRDCQARSHPLLGNIAEDHDQLVDLFQTFFEDLHILLRIILFRIDVGLDTFLKQELAQPKSVELILQVG